MLIGDEDKKNAAVALIGVKRNGRSRDDIILNYLFTRSGSVAGNTVFFFMLLVNSFRRGNGEGREGTCLFRSCNACGNIEKKKKNS